MNLSADHWNYVAAAYAVSLVGLAAIVVWVFVNLRHWAARARDTEKR